MKESFSAVKVIKFKKELGFSTSVERSNHMRKIKSNNTKPEIILRKSLWSRGIRYRKNVKSIIGSPDIFIGKSKLVIFVDGEFWHGYNWTQKKERIKSNREFWIQKIERNIIHDIEVNKRLEKEGYVVMRFWEHQISKDLENCVTIIMDHIRTESD